jgi:hypothetical protein
MSDVREMADPHLAAIRMVTQSMRRGDMYKLGSQLEGARFGLFAALDAEDYTKAMDWLNTLETGLACLEIESHPAVGPIKKALVSLRQLLEDETTEADETEAEEAVA